jgi:hypothetical protein
MPLAYVPHLEINIAIIVKQFTCGLLAGFSGIKTLHVIQEVSNNIESI